MRELLAGIHHFQNSVYRSRREFFERLADGQRPQAMLITCSDSRVDPSLITQSEPGSLFVLRNIGNIVPPYSPATRGCGAAAAIEYALAVLGIRDIIVCGHSHCGAMQGLLNSQLIADYPSVEGWLGNAESTRRIVKENYRHLAEKERLNVATQENVLVQLENLRTHPTVAAAMSRGDISLHGWVYKLDVGEIFGYDSDRGQFVRLGDDPSQATAAALATQAS